MRWRGSWFIESPRGLAFTAALISVLVLAPALLLACGDDEGDGSFHWLDPEDVTVTGPITVDRIGWTRRPEVRRRGAEAPGPGPEEESAEARTWQWVAEVTSARDSVWAGQVLVTVRLVDAEGRRLDRSTGSSGFRLWKPGQTVQLGDRRTTPEGRMRGEARIEAVLSGARMSCAGRAAWSPTFDEGIEGPFRSRAELCAAIGRGGEG